VNGKLSDGAIPADGQYVNINQNRQAVHIAAPQDREITELTTKLNDTYVAYGRMGNIARERQTAQE